jgi:hypothetical protein
MDSAETLEFELVLPDDGYGNGPVTLAFAGRVQSFPVQGSMGQVITTSLSIRITGDVSFTFPPIPGEPTEPTETGEPSTDEGKRRRRPRRSGGSGTDETNDEPTEPTEPAAPDESGE